MIFGLEEARLLFERLGTLSALVASSKTQRKYIPHTLLLQSEQRCQSNCTKGITLASSERILTRRYVANDRTLVWDGVCQLQGMSAVDNKWKENRYFDLFCRLVIHGLGRMENLFPLQNDLVRQHVYHRQLLRGASRTHLDFNIYQGSG